MRSFLCLVRDRRAAEPAQSFILAQDPARARAIARREFLTVPDVIEVAIFEEGKRVGVVRRRPIAATRAAKADATGAATPWTAARGPPQPAARFGSPGVWGSRVAELWRRLVHSAPGLRQLGSPPTGERSRRFH